MKKRCIRFLPVLLAVCILSGCGVQPTAPAQTGNTDASTVSQADTTRSLPETESDAQNAQQEEQLYTEYLQNGGYDTLLENFAEDKSEIEVEACLADFNGDGVRELMLSMIDKSLLGVRGYSSACVLLGIRNGAVEVQCYAFNGGGSMGGDTLWIKVDPQTTRVVPVYDSNTRDGMFAAFSCFTVYDPDRRDESVQSLGLDSDGSSVFETKHRLTAETYYEEGVYAQEAQRVMRETDRYAREDGFVTVYKYDGEYIAEEEYDAIRSSYTEPTDPAFQMKPVTLDDPIP